MITKLQRGVCVVGLIATVFSLSAFAALRPGEKAPEFTAEASLAGKDFTFSLGKALAKGPVVVYFFPSAFTGGCDIEAHTFAADKSKFTAAGATIIGVSADDIQRLNAFSSAPSYCAGKFPVASDSDLKIARAYGLTAAPTVPGMKDVRGDVIGHPFIPRTTFVIARDGRIVKVFSTPVDHITPAEHVTKSLAVVRGLAAN